MAAGDPINASDFTASQWDCIRRTVQWEKDNNTDPTIQTNCEAILAKVANTIQVDDLTDSQWMFIRLCVDYEKKINTRVSPDCTVIVDKLCDVLADRVKDDKVGTFGLHSNWGV